MYPSCCFQSSFSNVGMLHDVLLTFHIAVQIFRRYVNTFADSFSFLTYRKAFSIHGIVVRGI
jgi:hypothetical protein